MRELYGNNEPCNLDILSTLMIEKYSEDWISSVRLKPKLRTYLLIKDNYGTENYVKLNLTRSQRSLLCQLRIGILPLPIETGRFRDIRGIQENQRFCTFCKDQIENELHFMFTCRQYNNEHTSFLSSIEPLIGSLADQFKFLSNIHPRRLSKFICYIWSTRKKILYTTIT